MRLVFRPQRPAAALAVAAFAFLAGCGGAPPQGSPGGTPALTVDLAADNLAFDRSEITAPAGAPFAIRFENRESPPHNVSIRGQETVFTGETFSGPDERTYQVPALAAGQYTFLCDVHPDMQGTLISE